MSSAAPTPIVVLRARDAGKLRDRQRGGSRPMLSRVRVAQ